MVLNLFTPLFRSGMLKKIKDSIPDQPDINWIVVLCNERQILKAECEQLNVPYAIVHEPEGQKSIPHKVKRAFGLLKYGFLQHIDDDTTFNHNSYEAFKKYKDKYKLIIGQQKLNDGSIRPAQYPIRCHTDGAQMLVHTSIVTQVTFKCFSEDPQADCQYMLDCWDKTIPEERYILNEVISNYNALR